MRQFIRSHDDVFYAWLCELADRGAAMPVNNEIGDRFGFAPNAGTLLIQALERQKRIRITRHQNWRVVTIVATGQKLTSSGVNVRLNQPKLIMTKAPPAPLSPERLFLKQQQSQKTGSVVNWRTYGIVPGFNAKLTDGCKWIESDPIVELRAIPPRDPFCGAPRLDGKSYCSKHHPRTFVTTKRRGESEEPEQPKVAA